MAMYNDTTDSLLKLAENLEELAQEIEKEEAGGIWHSSAGYSTKTASRRDAIDYGTLGDTYNGSGTDPLTRFALG